MNRPDPRGLHREKPEIDKGELERKRQLFQRVFKSDDGQKVLEALRTTFERRALKAPEAHEMHYYAGQRDVVLYIDMFVNPPEKETYDGQRQELA